MRVKEEPDTEHSFSVFFSLYLCNKGGVTPCNPYIEPEGDFKLKSKNKREED